MSMIDRHRVREVPTGATSGPLSAARTTVGEPSGLVTVDKATDYDLAQAIADGVQAAVEEWRRRHPLTDTDRRYLAVCRAAPGWKGWGATAHATAWREAIQTEREAIADRLITYTGDSNGEGWAALPGGEEREARGVALCAIEDAAGPAQLRWGGGYGTWSCGWVVPSVEDIARVRRALEEAGCAVIGVKYRDEPLSPGMKGMDPLR